MEAIDTGGPAFPFEGGDNNGMSPATGMTLRDYFAAKAMQGWVAGVIAGRHSWSKKEAAEEAYALADAMIAARCIGVELETDEGDQIPW